MRPGSAQSLTCKSSYDEGSCGALPRRSGGAGGPALPGCAGHGRSGAARSCLGLHAGGDPWRGLGCASAAGKGLATTFTGVEAWRLPGAARRGGRNLAKSFGRRELHQVLSLVDDGDGAHDGVLRLPCR
jgi:hypothetical protein